MGMYMYKYKYTLKLNNVNEKHDLFYLLSISTYGDVTRSYFVGPHFHVLRNVLCRSLRCLCVWGEVGFQTVVVVVIVVIVPIIVIHRMLCVPHTYK